MRSKNIDEVYTAYQKNRHRQLKREQKLASKFKLSEVQAQAVLDLKLQRLTALERDKIVAEFDEIQKIIAELKAILADEKRVMKIISEELNEIKENMATKEELKSKVIHRIYKLEDLIQDEEMVVTISHRGYIKRNPISPLSSSKARWARQTRDEYS